MTLWVFFFFLLIDYSGVEEKNWFLFTDFETGQVAESLTGFTSSLEPVASLGRVSYAKNVTLLFVPFLPLLIPQRLVLSAGRPRTLPQTGDGALCLFSRS